MFKISVMVFCALSLFSASAFSQTATASPIEEKVTALLIIDIQDFYFPGGAMPLVSPEAASLNAARILEKFRKESRPIIHVGHNAKNKMGFHETVAPKNGEKVFYKNEVSAFNGTNLLSYLKEQKVQRLVIMGMQTHMCVEAAVRAAYDLGFECILVEDACATRNLKYKEREVSAEDVHDATLSTLDRTYATVIDTETFLTTY
ncbi:MAG: cysteine hydrolase family protein [Candidatus Krumholzibacteriia bacterium]